MDAEHRSKIDSKSVTSPVSSSLSSASMVALKKLLGGICLGKSFCHGDSFLISRFFPFSLRKRRSAIMQQSTGLLRPASTPQRGRLSFRIPSSHAKKPFPFGNGFSVTAHRFCCPHAPPAYRKERNVCKGNLCRVSLARLIKGPPLAALIFAPQKSAAPKESHPLGGSLLVPRRGFEPRTPCLKGRCSTY